MREAQGPRPDAAERRQARGRQAAPSSFTAPDGGARTAAFVHAPVMLTEVLRRLRPEAGETVVDATVGGGGHAAAVIAALGPGGRLLGVDRDPAACRAAEQRLQPLAAQAQVALHLAHANFTEVDGLLDQLGWGEADGFLFDLGVSSFQLDTGERGFSYRQDAPLDMRMDPTQGTTAYHLVNGLSEAELAELIRRFGEERWARRIAAFIVRHRNERGLIATTGDLVEVVKAAVPTGSRRAHTHPARRTFQALRIAVNNELGALEAALRTAVRRLRPGGRLVALSFHSLEDRIVKNVIREFARGCTCPPQWPVCRCGAEPLLRPLVQRPLQADAEECEINPRARSAKLRAAERLAGEAVPAEPEWDVKAHRAPPSGPLMVAAVPSLAQTLRLPRRRRAVLDSRRED